jgi:hypothetical protein
MKNDAASRSLCLAIERRHGCQARLREVVGIDEQIDGKTLWKGKVYVFTLNGHPRATVAYGWLAPSVGSPAIVEHTVLGIPPIDSPMDAIRASGPGGEAKAQ